jgi:hypothetical protein
MWIARSWRQHISVATADAKPMPRQVSHPNWLETLLKKRKCVEIGPKMPTTTNNMVRVHPAQPSYSVVVPAMELGASTSPIRMR